MTAAAAPARATPLLRMEGIEKSFPGVRALDGVGLDLAAGEVLAVVGENGAGKSTLIKVLAGAHAPDAGRVLIDGADPAIRTPLDARRSGVAVIYQELSLVPTLSARENIHLGRERTRLGFLSAAAERAEVRSLLGRLGVDLDPEAPVGTLPVAQQQVVEIAKALALEGRIIVMDEPTATLTARETASLFRIIADLKAQGLGVIYISHRLEEVFEIADRVLVLRDGAVVADRPVGELDRAAIIQAMVGRPLDEEFPEREGEVGEVRLAVEALRRGRVVRDASLDVRRGEVVGLAGLVGAGRTELARLIAGVDPADGGEVRLDGRRLALRSPRDAIRSGICLLPEDRKAQGLLLGRSVRENFGLPNLGHWSRLGLVDAVRERDALGRYVDQLRIKAADVEAPAASLSGGNQQKVVLARWLEANSAVVIFDEPTRGVDVGAKLEIYQLIGELARRGKAILMISSELPELLGLCDRILVMREGRVVGEIAEARSATQEEVLALAVGSGGPAGEGAA